MPRASRRIVIELYDWTTEEEISDILDSIVRVGIDSARLVTDCAYCNKEHDPRHYCHEA